MATDTLGFDDLYRLTAEQYMHMAEHGSLPKRGIELIDGLIVKMSPQGRRHRRTVDRLAEFFVLAGRRRYTVSAQTLSLALDSRTMVEPDVAIMARAVDDDPGPPELDLVIEVADSSLRRDLIFKRRRYARAGVREYWVIDVEHEVVHVLSDPHDEDFRSHREVKRGEPLAPAAYPDVVIDLNEVLPPQA